MTIKVVDQGEFRDDNRQSDDHEPPQNISSSECGYWQTF